MTLDKTVLELANTLGIALTDIHTIYAEAIAGIAILNLIGFAVFCIAMIITLGIIIKNIIKRNESSNYESDRACNSFFKLDWEEEFPTVFMLMLCAFLVIGISCTVCVDAVQRFSYPEYFAIKEMLSIIGT